MIASKKYNLIVLFFLCSIHVMAQEAFYYYKGNKIPLIVNESKVCISIPKEFGRISESILDNVKEQGIINDDFFDIYILLLSDYKHLTHLDFWQEAQKNVITSSCYFTENKEEVFLSPYLNIRLKEEQDLDLLNSFAKEYSLKIIKRDSLMPLWYILSITQECKKNALEYANIIWESGKFAASVPDLCSDNDLCSNDPLFYLQWGLQNNVYTGIDISVTSAWNYSTGKNIKIGILDTGVDLNHSDLISNISSLSFDTETNSSPSMVYANHGTHCAGIAAAVKDNGIMIAGVAPDAKIVSISNSYYATTCSQIKRANGIIWAYQNGVDVISNSWHSPSYHYAIDEAIKDAFKYGRQGKGCIIVFASGNNSNSNINYPANCNDTILAVGAINKGGMRATFSNYGSGLDIVAPGDSIISTIPNNLIAMDNGTSMATPHVAGVAALILERNPELTVNQVNSIINSNAKKLSGVNFNVNKPDGLWNNEYGYGLVDAYNSVINTPHVVYIQNDTITGTKTINADEIYVGRNVAVTIPQGDVILGQGNIKLKASFIEIKNSTTVPIGTSLEIVNQ